MGGGGTTDDLTLNVLVDYNGGVEVVDDSLNIKISGLTLALSAAGLYVNSVAGVTGANEDNVTITDVQTACTNDFHNIGGTDDDTPDSDSEVPDNITIGSSGSVNDAAIPSGITRDSEWDTASEINTATTDADFLTANQSITLSGDASGTGTTSITVAVSDDSHSHTSSTISGIDISSDTNLKGNSEIVLTGDSLYIATSVARDSELAPYLPLASFDDSLAASPAVEKIQDIVGAMTTGNTEADISVTYQDVDGNIDYEVASGITRDTEWDTTTEINAATTDTDFLTSEVGDISSVAVGAGMQGGGTTGAVTVYADSLSWIATNTDVNAKVGKSDSFSGDVTGAYNATVVGNNSHSHTTSTLSGIDISDDTNLSGNTEIVLTDDALSIASAITRDTEWDTISEINSATTDADIIATNSSWSGGDLGGTGLAPSVTDDSHNHVISNVDNLADTLNTRIRIPASSASGDILYYNTSWTRLAKGSDNKVLKLISGLPSWQDDNTGTGGASYADSARVSGTTYDFDNYFTADSINGAKLKANSIVDEHINFSDLTLADFTNDPGYMIGANFADSLSDNDDSYMLSAAFADSLDDNDNSYMLGASFADSLDANDNAYLTAEVGDISGVTAGTGLSGGGSSGSVTVNADSTSWVASDYQVGLRLLSSAFGDSLDANDNSYLTSETGDISAVTAGWGISGGGSSGSVTVTADSALVATRYWVTATYPGDITGVTAGDGLGGGGSSGSVTETVLFDYNGGIETGDDSLNVKLDGSTLSLSSSGLKITDTYDDNFLTSSSSWSGGDLGGTGLAPSVNDDSHNHTIANIDNLGDTLAVKMYKSDFPDSIDAHTELLTTSSSWSGGDLGGTGLAPSVSDDSHNHTISNVDNLSDSLLVRLFKSDFADSVGAISWTGDLGGTGKSPSVDDDSHNHTIANVDNLGDTLNVKMYASDFSDSLSAATSDETIQDLIGAMFTGNTETGIAVDYQDADGTVDLVISETGDISGVTAGWGISGGGSSGAVTVTADSASVASRYWVTNTYPGDITGVTAGWGISGGGTSGAPTVTADSASVATRYWVTSTYPGDITGVTAGDGLGGGGSSGTVTENVLADYDGGIEIADDSLNVKLNGTNLAVTSAGLTTGSAVTLDAEWDTAAEINSATTDADFLTSETGDISGVTAGNGLDGGGSSGAVTLNAIVNYNGGIEVVDDSLNVKLNGANLALSSAGLTTGSAVTLDAEWDTASEINAATTDVDFLTSETGDISGVTAGDGLGGGGTTGAVTLDALLDYDGGLATVDDSLNVKLNGSNLALSSSGLTTGSAVTLDTEWDSVSEINAATADADFYYAGGTDVADADVVDALTLSTVSGAVDMGGATSLEIPNAADPDIDAAGEIAQDTDGANESGDVSLRGYDGTNQFAFARKLHTIQATVIKPNDLADATRDKCTIWSNESGMTFTVTKIEGWADTDDTSINIEEYDADGTSNNATVDAVEIATGSGPYTCTETTISGAGIEADHVVVIDFDDTDDPGWVKVTICGWYNANVD